MTKVDEVTNEGLEGAEFALYIDRVRIVNSLHNINSD